MPNYCKVEYAAFQNLSISIEVQFSTHFQTNRDILELDLRENQLTCAGAATLATALGNGDTCSCRISTFFSDMYANLSVV